MFCVSEIWPILPKTISNTLLDELPKGCKRPEDVLGDAGLMKELKVRLMERMGRVSEVVEIGQWRSLRVN